MGFWNFIAIGCLGILVGIAVFHFAWSAPQVERKGKMSEVVNAAHSVQLAAIQHYALMPGANASNIDLEQNFPDKGAASRLLALSTETGIYTDTGFVKGTFGNALALSNFVLMGNSNPQFLTVTEMKSVITQRRNNLMNSVPLWP
jgi:enhancing lycopene biosynthesis protein 2